MELLLQQKIKSADVEVKTGPLPAAEGLISDLHKPMLGGIRQAL